LPRRVGPQAGSMAIVRTDRSRSDPARTHAPCHCGTMKLKRLPEDFRVEELPIAAGGSEGRFVLYRLTKRNLGTLEAIEAICRRWNIAGRRVSYGGLKDRHALTVQYLTIFDGPDAALHQANLDLEPTGRLAHPYGPGHFRGNRFSVVLRDLTGPALEHAV